MRQAFPNTSKKVSRRSRLSLFSRKRSKTKRRFLFFMVSRCHVTSTCVEHLRNWRSLAKLDRVSQWLRNLGDQHVLRQVKRQQLLLHVGVLVVSIRSTCISSLELETLCKCAKTGRLRELPRSRLCREMRWSADVRECLLFASLLARMRMLPHLSSH